MYIIGLTGGIATGKSTVSSMLQVKGIPVIDADVCAREVVMQGRPAWHELVNRLGRRILLPDGALDRAAIGKLVFADKQLRQWIDEVTHPAIIDMVQSRLAALDEQGVRMAVLDAPLLIEAGFYRQVDEVWLVYSDKRTQLQRLMDRNGFTKEEAERRIAAQLSLEEKKEYADVVIDNSGSLEKTAQQLAAVWQGVCQRAIDKSE